MSMMRRDFIKAAISAVALGTSSVVAGASSILGVAGSATFAPKYPFKWWVSLDGGEVFQEPFSTRDEAVRSAKEYGGALVAECQQQDFDLRVDGDSLIEMLYGRNEELMGEDAEFIDPTAEQTKELGDEVTKVVEAWAQRNKIDTKAFIFGEVRNKEVVGEPTSAQFADLPTDDIRDDPLYLNREKLPA